MEFVWVVPRREILGSDPIQGFQPLDPAQLESRFLGPIREAGFFLERRYAETHPEFKQPIPYVVVARPGAEGEEALCLTRLATQGEKRLHGRRSIGVGGHVNPCDAGDDLLAAACERELHEELVLPEDPLRLTPIGLLNDDETEVGAVHLGIVYRLDADGLSVSIRETSAMSGDFESLVRLAGQACGPDDPFESWSSLLLRSGALAPGELATGPCSD